MNELQLCHRCARAFQSMWLESGQIVCQRGGTCRPDYPEAVRTVIEADYEEVPHARTEH